LPPNKALQRTAHEAAPPLASRPALDWDRCLTSPKAGDAFREEYYRAFMALRPAARE
jgi:hypothetical protein